MVAQKDYASLLRNDQLLNERKKNALLQTFHEGELKFDPTYRYDKLTDNYDTSKKHRAPAWCDRILFSRDCATKKELCRDIYAKDDAQAAIPLHYSRPHSFFSDHRPILALYKVQVVKTSNEKKALMQKMVAEDLVKEGRITSESQQAVNNKDYSKKMKTAVSNL